MNLDAMSHGELIAIAQNERHDPNVRQYARHKARAMRHRVSGQIRNALDAEKYCDYLYTKIPVDLRW